MLDFRKWILALAVVLTATVASAQTVPAFQCVANAGVPPIVRAEGVAELLGDIVLNCNNGTPTAQDAPIPQINVQVFLNTNVTSKWTDPWTEAILMIDEPAPLVQKACVNSSGGCVMHGRWNSTTQQFSGPVYDGSSYTLAGTSYTRYNMFNGRTNGVNSVVWLGVPIDAPGTTGTRIIRITNLRGNANQLGVSSTLVPTQIVAFISMTGPTSIPINNPQQTVAFVQTGLSQSVRNLNFDSGSVSLNQCSARDINGNDATNVDIFTNPSDGDKGCFDFVLRFEESFASSFKTRYNGSATVYSDQHTPGAIFTNSESGFMSTNSNWGTLARGSTISAGEAAQGTRLRAVFNNVPAGVRIYVSIEGIKNTGGNQARLVNVSADGTGPYAETPQVNTSRSDCVNKDGNSDSALQSKGFAEVPIFGGTGTAVWEVTANDPLQIGRVQMGVIAAYKPQPSVNLPALGQSTVNLMFAPVPNASVAADWPKYSTVFPVPRFVDTSSARNTFKIEACETNLLFPFVTNQVGFDTGLVISNTTKDPFGTENQNGACTLYYYGDTNGAAPPPSQTSGTVPAGDYLAWGLSSGGKFGVTATPGFQGYIIARCKFQMAHGFAYISDLGNQKTAHGYLALVLDGAFDSPFRGQILGESRGQ